MKQKTRLAALISGAILMLSLFGCGGGGVPAAASAPAAATEAQSRELTEYDPGYEQMPMSEAEEYMSRSSDFILLDLRTRAEFSAYHIPGAICLPNEDIGGEMPDILPDPGRTILVYCRSGRRSKEAARKLADLGYTNVIEIGGILDYEGETAAGEEP